jgi:hypothetical protein
MIVKYMAGIFGRIIFGMLANDVSFFSTRSTNGYEMVVIFFLNDEF